MHNNANRKGFSYTGRCGLNNVIVEHFPLIKLDRTEQQRRLDALDRTTGFGLCLRPGPLTRQEIRYLMSHLPMELEEVADRIDLKAYKVAHALEGRYPLSPPADVELRRLFLTEFDLFMPHIDHMYELFYSPGRDDFVVRIGPVETDPYWLLVA